MSSPPRILRWASLWRGSLLPLQCAALANVHSVADFGAAAQPSGSKLPRHRVFSCYGNSRLA
ncbi:hypothetical protein EPZ47_21555 [Pseudomonas viciae]|uniref:Uncharacterized protein n=1 Tax=Pseudomonas viciae TaxID=2505979 RepID=A0A4P7PK01_9PSED|nr:hypothetical protein EPZ47_21555 [Pseudomonas viciae]